MTVWVSAGGSHAVTRPPARGLLSLNLRLRGRSCDQMAEEACFQMAPWHPGMCWFQLRAFHPRSGVSLEDGVTPVFAEQKFPFLDEKAARRINLHW